MSNLRLTPEIESLARRVVWFEEPAEAISNTPRFLAYAMTFGSYADIQLLRKQLSDDSIRDALDNAPPGIFDPRSWSYWNLRFDRYPTPPMPIRTFGEKT